MAVLNLRSEDPGPEPGGFRLFEKPDETPPGLDAIRAWLRKPRPRLHGAWIWVRWILSGIPAAYRYLRKNWPAARERIRRIASEGEKVARGAVRIGYVARDIGGGIVRSTRALRGPDGKVSGVTARVRAWGRATRAFGGRLTEGGGGVAAAFSSLRRLTRADPGASAVGLGLLDPPAEPEPDETDAAPRRLRTPPARPSAKPAPAREGPRRTTPPAPTEAPAQPAEEAHQTGVPVRAPPPAASGGDEEERLKGLPEVFFPMVKALRERPRREVLQALVLDICRWRDWTTPAELARWFAMHQRSLVKRHLRPMTKAGLLELRHPGERSSPRQAYRTRRDGRSPQEQAAALPVDG